MNRKLHGICCFKITLLMVILTLGFSRQSVFAANAAPSGLRVLSKSDCAVSLTWNNISSPPLDYIEIYCNDTKVNSDNTLRPADTSAAVGHYEAATSENNEHIAVYTIGYVASGNVDVKIFVSNVVYEYADETDQNRTTLHNQRDAYLTSILRFCITMGSAQDSWTINYMEANKGNLTPISLLSGASGSLSCKVRFAQVINDTITPVSQELIPPFYDGVKISFVLNAEVQD